MMNAIDGMEPGNLVREIQVAIENSGLDTPKGQGGLALQSVSITLKCLVQTTAGVAPKFTVPFVGWKVGGSIEITDQDLQTINVVLKTPWAKKPKKSPADALLSGPGSIRDVLPGAIESIRAMLAQGQSSRLSAASAKVD